MIDKYSKLGMSPFSSGGYEEKLKNIEKSLKDRRDQIEKRINSEEVEKEPEEQNGIQINESAAAFEKNKEAGVVSGAEKNVLESDIGKREDGLDDVGAETKNVSKEIDFDTLAPDADLFAGPSEEKKKLIGKKEEVKKNKADIWSDTLFSGG